MLSWALIVVLETTKAPVVVSTFRTQQQCEENRERFLAQADKDQRKGAEATCFVAVADPRFTEGM